MHVYKSILLILLRTLIVTGNGLNNVLVYCTVLVRVNEWDVNVDVFAV